MSGRQEFSRKVMAAAFQRAGGKCETCGAHLRPGKFQYDHILPDVLGGEPALENCRVLCTPCHAGKTADDVRRTRKADRQRDRHIGAMKKSRRPMPGSRNSPWKRTFSNGWISRKL